MSPRTEVKLLTLLNVTAIKKPRALDKPGGHRGSLDARSTSTPQSPRVSNGVLPNAAQGDSATTSTRTNGTATGTGAETSDPDHPVVKKRKSVVFAGEVGPSGSTYSSPIKGMVNGKGKGKAKEVTAVIGSPSPNGQPNGHNVDSVALAEGVVDEDEENPKSESV